MRYNIYTDGSYQSSYQAGGFSAIILQDGNIIKKIYRGFRNTTNNRMELRGIIAALEFLTEDDEAIIYSDSQYVLNNIGHAKKWLKDNDLSKKNLDLWIQLLEALDNKSVYFVWVKGHADNQYNEIADMYAQHAAQCLNLPIDIITNADTDKETW